MYMMSRSSSSMGNGDNENVEEEATTEETKSFFQIPIHCEPEYTRLHQSFSQYSLYTLVSESHGSHGISFPSSGSRQYEQSSLYHWIVMNYRNVTPDHLYTNLLFPKLSLLLPSKNMTDVNRIAESKIRIERMASLYSKNREDSHGHGVYKRMVVVPDVTQQTEIVFQYLLPIRIEIINWHHLKYAQP